MRNYVASELAKQEAGLVVRFVTVAKAIAQVVGSTSFLNIDRQHRRVEIGGTWITPAWQRSAINTEAKYLQLRHAFETLGCIRVEFKTDVLNTKITAGASAHWRHRGRHLSQSHAHARRADSSQRLFQHHSRRVAPR